MEKDIAEELRQSAVQMIDARVAQLMIRAASKLDELHKEIEFLRSTVGVISRGQTFDEIKKSL